MVFGCLNLKFRMQELNGVTGVVIKTIIVRLIDWDCLKSQFLFDGIGGMRVANIFDGVFNIIFLLIEGDIDVVKFIGYFRWFSSIDIVQFRLFL